MRSGTLELLSGLTSIPNDDEQFSRLMRWMHIIFGVLASLVVLAFTLGPATDIWFAIQQRNGPALQKATGDLWAAAVATVSFRMLWLLMDRVLVRAHLLKEAIRDTGGRIGTVVAEQPAPLGSQELAPGFERFGPLTPLSRRQAREVRAAPFWLFGLGAMLGLIWAAFLFTAHDQEEFLNLLEIVLGILIAAFLGGGALMLKRIRFWRRPIYVEADEWELRYRSLRGGKRIFAMRWSDVHGLFVVYDTLGRDLAIAGYLLAGTDTMLTWECSENSTPEELAASKRFLRLIVSRAKVPLRDLTATLSEPMAVPADSRSQDAIAHLAAYKPRRSLLVRAIFAVQLAMIAALYVAGWVLQAR